jgi:hypothetical protein
MLCERLRRLWRLKAGLALILPPAVREKRFFALLFVFNLGILNLPL